MLNATYINSTLWGYTNRAKRAIYIYKTIINILFPYCVTLIIRWVFRQLYDKGLVYRGYKVCYVHHMVLCDGHVTSPSFFRSCPSPLVATHPSLILKPRRIIRMCKTQQVLSNQTTPTSQTTYINYIFPFSFPPSPSHSPILSLSLPPYQSLSISPLTRIPLWVWLPGPPPPGHSPLT